MQLNLKRSAGKGYTSYVIYILSVFYYGITCFDKMAIWALNCLLSD